MAEITFTKGQEQAIHDEGKNILVAASAGSGKTRVLVERVIEKIKANTSVEELLILTFTEAAAREMKERIQAAIRQAIQQEDDSEKKRFYLQQLTKLNIADISTIDAFCLRIVKNYYYVVGLDPEFRLLTDETERILLRESVWDDLREELYGKEDELFEQLTLNFSNDRSDDGLTELIMELFDFANVNPDPKQWIRDLAKNYQLKDGNLEQSAFYQKSFLPFVAEKLNQASEQLKQALAILADAPNENGKLDKLEALYVAEAEMLTELKDSLASFNSYDELQQALKAVTFKRAPGARLEEDQKPYKDQAATLRTVAKETVEELFYKYFINTRAELLTLFSEAEKLTNKAGEVLLKFMQRYQSEKRRRHVLEFSDLEHLTLQILRQKDDTNVSELLKERYQEIMVDEYQDTNQLQEAILTTLARDNMFMVGDVKQSIYAFRLADPTLFLHKYHEFAKADHPDERIILAENFRSAENITATTNFIFTQIMDKRIGEMDYDKSAQLVYGLGKTHPIVEEMSTEIMLYTSENDPKQVKEQPIKMRWDEGEELAPDFEVNSSTEGQLALVAKRIKELCEQGYEIYDRNLKQIRPVTYGDIAILSETRTNHLLLSEELKKREIPFYIQKSQNYFQTTELRIMLALLALIDNPYQDIELVAVLRSPIVGLKENELAYLRINSKSGAYYQAVEKFYHRSKDELKEPFEEALHEKITHFMQQLTHFRDLAHKDELSNLILAIYEETGFLDYVGGMPGGSQRQANLHALYERAAMYEKSSFKGLFQFIGFIKKMQSKNDDLAEATLQTSEDTVNIMTIHGSKGLEFPIVFLIDATKKFNQRSLNKKYLLSEKDGLALTYLDPVKRIEHETLQKNIAKNTAKMKGAAEKMRLLYVALTRAQEKLIIVGGYPTKEDALKVLNRGKGPNTLLDDEVRANANCFLDWILPAVARHPAVRRACELETSLADLVIESNAEFELEFLSYVDIVTELDLPKFDLSVWLERQIELKKALSAKTIQKIDEILAGKYQYQGATKTAAYQAVSELKRLFDDPDLEQMAKITPELKQANRQTSDFAMPRFMVQETKVSPAAIGTAVHLLLQELDLTTPPTLERLKELLERLVADQVITPEVADKIDLAQVFGFYETPLGKQVVANQKTLRRELPFSMVLPAGNVFANLDETVTDPILVHGIMDGYYVNEDDEVVLFDYKTDKIINGDVEAIKERYYGQLQLYQKALEQILQKPVAHKYLYLFDNQQAIEL